MLVLGEHIKHDPRKGLAALRDAPFILPWRGDSASFYDHVFLTCRAAGFVPKVVQEVDVFFTALNLVRAGLGVSMAPSAIQLMRVPGVRFANTLVPEAEWDAGLAWHRFIPRSVLAENFLQMARKSITATIR